MSIFTVEKPRRFDRKPYFNNERKEYLEKRKRAIMRQEGLLPMEELTGEELIRGKFVQGTTHLRRRMEQDAEEPDAKQKRWSKLMLWIIILVVLFVWLIREVYSW